MKTLIFCAAALVGSVSSQAADNGPRLDIASEVQGRAQSPCARAAITSVLEDYAILVRAQKAQSTGLVTDIGNFRFKDGAFVTITVCSPQRLHWVVSVNPRTPNCDAGQAIEDFYDDERGGGGVSVHN